MSSFPSPKKAKKIRIKTKIIYYPLETNGQTIILIISYQDNRLLSTDHDHRLRS